MDEELLSRSSDGYVLPGIHYTPAADRLLVDAPDAMLGILVACHTGGELSPNLGLIFAGPLRYLPLYQELTHSSAG